LAQELAQPDGSEKGGGLAAIKMIDLAGARKSGAKLRA